MRLIILIHSAYTLEANMKKLTKILLLNAIFLTSTGGAFAANNNSDFTTKEQFIDGLTPKPKYKLRGIKLNDADDGAPAAPPSISMKVNFAFDSFNLSDQIKAKLNPLGEALMSEQLIKYSFEIAGHTDATGLESYNQALSGKRAVSVGQYLYDTYGVDPSRLKLSGYGEEQLLDPANPKSGENRRVEITTLVADTGQ